MLEILYNNYEHAIELINRNNLPKAKKNINLMHKLLALALKESSCPEKSYIIKCLKIWIEDAESKYNQRIG